MARHPHKHSLSSIPFLKFLVFSPRRSKPVMSQGETPTSTPSVLNCKYPAPTSTDFDDAPTESMNSNSLTSHDTLPVMRGPSSSQDDHNHELSKPHPCESTLSLQIHPPYRQPANGDPEDFPIVSEAHLRKRKMDKIVKILGESIPPQLVFPSMPLEVLMLEFVPDTHEIRVLDNTTTNRLRRSSSLPSKRSTISKPRRSSTSNSKLDNSLFSSRTAEPPSIDFTPATNMVVTKAKLDSSTGSSSVLNPATDMKPWLNQNEQENIPFPPSVSPTSRAPRRRPSTASRLERTLFTFRSSDMRQDPMRSEYSLDHDSSPAEDDATPISLSDSEELGDNKTDLVNTHWHRLSKGREKLPSSFVTRRDSEGGWSGEWNTNDMHYIIDQLRRLK